MPNSVLNQLKALRDGVAQDLRKDPRYLTLQALDKSIEEISSVLADTGLVPKAPAPSALSQRMGTLAPKADPYAEPVAVLSSAEPAAEAAHHDGHPDHTPGFKDGTAGTPQPAVPHHALTSYAGDALAIAGAAALAAGAVHAASGTGAPAEGEDGGHKEAMAEAAGLTHEPVPEDETAPRPEPAAHDMPDAGIAGTGEPELETPEAGVLDLEPAAVAHEEPPAATSFETKAAEAVAAALAFGATDFEAAGALEPHDAVEIHDAVETHEAHEHATDEAHLTHEPHEAHEPGAIEAAHPEEIPPALEDVHSLADGEAHAGPVPAEALTPALQAHEDLHAHEDLEAHEALPAHEEADAAAPHADAVPGPAEAPVAASAAFETAAADAIAAALFAGEDEEAHDHLVPADHHSTEAGQPEAVADHQPAIEAVAASAIASALFLDEEPVFDKDPALAEEHVLDDEAVAGHESLLSEEPEAAVHAPEAAADPAGVEHEPAGAGLVAAVIPEGKASGYLPMTAKTGAAPYSPSIAVKFGKLPNKVDLRPLLAEIEDQGQTNSSVANAVTSAYEYWIKKATKKSQTLSRLFVYYNARWRLGLEESDAGAAIQLAMDGLQKFGACQDNAWPADSHLLAKRPGTGAYQNGAPYRIHDTAQVPLKLEAWKQALAEGKPVVFAVAIFESFQHCAGTGGVVSMPAPSDLGHLPHAAHALCAVGYSEAEHVFIVRNSWGKTFGDGGYCYMPYSYVLNPKFNDGDCWIFIPKVPSQPPRETWHDSAEPVTNAGKGVDFEIAPHAIADYEAVSADLFEDLRRPFEPHAPESYNDCAAKVAKSQFTDLPDFDVKSFLETTRILAGIGSAIHSMVDEATPPPVAAAPAAGSDEEWGHPDSWGTSTAIDHDRATGPETAAAAKISA